MGLGLKTFWQAFFCPETGQDSILLLKQLIRSVSKPGDTPDRIWKKSALRDRLPPPNQQQQHTEFLKTATWDFRKGSIPGNLERMGMVSMVILYLI